MSDENQHEDEQKSQPGYWIGAAVGVIAAAVGGTLLGLHIGRQQAGQSDAFRPNDEKLLLTIANIERSTDWQTKLQSIDAHVASADWTERLGGALACFSELEGFLDAAIVNLRPDYVFDRKNYHRKIGFLRAEGCISEVDHSLLSNVSDVRNKLSHGSYEQVSEVDLRAACTAVREFFDRHLPQNSSAT